MTTKVAVDGERRRRIETAAAQWDRLVVRSRERFPKATNTSRANYETTPESRRQPRRRRHRHRTESEALTPAGQEVAPPSALLEGLAVAPRHVGRSRFDYLVEVDGEDVVRGLPPDLDRLRRLDVRG